jgi:hypothetical protein
MLYAFFALSALLFVFCVWRYTDDKKRLIKQDEQNAVSITKKAAEKIARFAHEWKATVDTIAQELSAGRLPYADINKRLQQKPSDMRGLGVAFTPYAYDKKTPLFAPYFVTIDNVAQLVQLEKTIDYSQASYERFAKIINTGAQWLNPFWDDVNNKLIWEYAAPFYDKDHKPIGIVFGNYAIDYIQSFIASTYPSNYGYGEIYTKKGIFVSHPNYQYIGHSKTPVDIALDAHDPELAEIFRKALRGEVEFDYEKSNWLSAQRSLITFEPVAGTDWLTQGVFVVSEFETKTTQLQRQFINIIISLMIFLIALLLLVLHNYGHRVIKLWIISSAIALAMLIIISFIWYGLATRPAKEQGEMIQNNFNIDTLQEKYKKSSTTKNSTNDAQTKNTPYTLIPTGIYLYNIILGMNSVTLSGYVWQQIPLGKANSITPGLVLPQAQGMVIEKAYEKANDAWKIISWKIQGTLAQDFDFFDYPLDSKQINIELWPVNADEKIILIPDFYGYKVFNATSLPGINRNIQLQDWHLNESYFSFQKESALTNLGHHSPQSYTFDIATDTIEKLHLHFNIEARRNAVGALALSLMPIIIILVLLFILLLMAGAIEFQFMFGSIASLFFTSLIAYTAFKTHLAIQNVIFLDYIYFLLQGSILAIAVMGILYQKKLGKSAIKHEKVFVIQLLFWPFIMAGVLLLSFIFFY